MADVELIIKIPEEQYKFIKQSMTMDKVKDYHALLYDICEHIANGTPLPEGHGDLVYKNDVKHKINQDCLTFERDLNEDINPAKAIMECLIVIDEIKPIIEADTVESEE